MPTELLSVKETERLCILLLPTRTMPPVPSKSLEDWEAVQSRPASSPKGFPREGVESLIDSGDVAHGMLAFGVYFID